MLHMYCGQWRLPVTTRPLIGAGLVAINGRPGPDRPCSSSLQAWLRRRDPRRAPGPGAGRSDADRQPLPLSPMGSTTPQRLACRRSALPGGQDGTLAVTRKWKWSPRTGSSGWTGMQWGLYIQRGVLVSRLDPALLTRCRQSPGEAVRHRCRAASQGPPHRSDDAASGKAPGE